MIKCPYCEAEDEKISNSDNLFYKYKCLKCGNYFKSNRDKIREEEEKQNESQKQ